MRSLVWWAGGPGGVDMTGRRIKSRPDWRNYLTSVERLDLEALEENAQKLDARRRELTAQITLHRNRCVRRREAALARKALEGVGQ